ncbi:MAG: FAD-linked oxidase C-terminal domain-containing protein [Bacteroidota bacterium]|nr:FAD-linked oxidase C-terminal domain-containing protein [Bacteroidota bacterium]
MRQSETFSNQLALLRKSLEGDLFEDNVMRLLYSTDASAYKETPLAVIRPKKTADIQKIIEFATANHLTLIPRTAGTSVAGQVVGNGIVVDVSKYMNRILEVNEKEHWVRVQPGVVLDELNLFLQPYGLFFGPETSTSNRCMIGGMTGNNSCGAHSIIYGSTRDHVIEIKAVLSDGREVTFSSLTPEEFKQKCSGNLLENKIYQHISDILSDPENQAEIRKEYPDPDLKRRNNGYAIDLLLETQPFTGSGQPFNFCKLLAGSEGTLAFFTEIKLNLFPLPPKEKGLICVHCHSVDEALRANLLALQHHPDAIEMMDKLVLDLSKDNIGQKPNRFFIHGDPGALLLIEFARNSREELGNIKEAVENDLKAAGYGYDYSIIYGTDIKKVWAVRKAGLGLLSNMPGDAKPVAVTEDTAVNPQVLPEYIEEFKEMLSRYKLHSVYYGHAATGELHLRPILNLKDPKDIELFHTVALETARLVKKYKGSISGEHGDGRLRGEFLPLMVGEKNYRLLCNIKATWDPENIFNAHKITDTPAMNTSLRYAPGQETREIDTVFDFSQTMGILRMAEKCNGSADCRKTSLMGGTMCPSYQATHDEKNTTRARSNMLREFLTLSPKENPFDHKELYEIMDTCLSCKGCKSECPSSVDMAKMKAEFLQHYYDANGIPFRTWAIANIDKIDAWGAIFPSVTNFVLSHQTVSTLLKKMLGFATQRTMPLLSKESLRKWAKHSLNPQGGKYPNGKVYLFNDEFTNYNDTEIGIKAIKLLNRLGYEVVIPQHIESGRAYISKGLIRKARKIASKNVMLLKDLVTAETPLLGIEPSAILSFRDEYPDLVEKALQETANQLATNVFLIDEFLASEIDKGHIQKGQFTSEARKIKYHGHCQQKSVASIAASLKILSFPGNYEVEEIKSGCCGMAGSFGFEKEHYELSMKIGEMVLFPEIRNTPGDVLISAEGTSCRHQIKDGTGRRAFHPVEILYDALIQKQAR